jgi:8-oxo-dGTP diphosphatase
MTLLMDPLPYKIAVLCYLYDSPPGAGRVLLLHRVKDPNAGMYSPIGGKLETFRGEGPHECALREIREESGITLGDDEIRLCGIVSERAYEGQTHWLIFLFEVLRAIDPSEIIDYDMREGRLEWVPLDRVASIGIPQTDREIMWPSVQAHRGGFFMVHIDCSTRPMTWRIVESTTAAAPRAAVASRPSGIAVQAPRGG